MRSTDEQPIVVGDVVAGKYRVERELGQGGMASVFAATHLELGGLVALKFIAGAKDKPRRDEAIARLTREGRAMFALNCEHVARVFDVGALDSGVPYLVMEYLEGRDLEAVVQEGALRVARAVDYVLQACIGVREAHALGIVHRDLKPSNLFLARLPDGREIVKVIDFGISKPLDPEPDDVALTSTRSMIGTPRYMAPERFDAGAEASPTADIWALGAVLYLLLTGRPLFDAPTAFSLHAKLLTEEPIAPDEIRPDIPRALSELTMRCLRRNPAERFATAAELALALERVRAALEAPPSADELMTTQRARNTPARGVRWPTWLAGAAVASAALAFVAYRAANAPRPVGAPSASALGASSASASNASSAIPNAGAPVAVTELPDPPAANPEALRAYRAAMQAYRDGVGGLEVRFKRALELDPDLAAAHMRLALLEFQSSPSEAREKYQRAFELRALLSDHDKTLLEAIEPLFVRQPPDREEYLRRMEKATAKFPLDAEMWMRLGFARSDTDLEGAMRARKRAVELDPRFATAWWQLGQHQAYLGQLDDARASLKRCTEVSPTATACIWNQIAIDELDGACDTVEDEARRWIAVDAKDPLGYFALAGALEARGKPALAIHEALRQREAQENDASRPETAAADAMLLATFAGDFAEVERRARELERLVANAPSENEHQPAARALVETYLETGRAALAADYADAYLRRREAWLADPYVEDFAIANDLTMPMQRALAAAGRINRAELGARRDAWMAAWKPRVAPALWPYLWIHAYGLADTKEEALEALAALAAPLPAYTPKTLGLAQVGRTYLLAERGAEALPFLQRAASSCMALEFPFEHTRAHLWLGRAREASRDVDGACKAYRVVLDRWGNAKPRSVSAEEARARTKTLGCK